MKQTNYSPENILFLMIKPSKTVVGILYYLSVIQLFEAYLNISIRTIVVYKLVTKNKSIFEKFRDCNTLYNNVLIIAIQMLYQISGLSVLNWSRILVTFINVRRD